MFNKTVLQAKSPRELTDAVVAFMDCSIVIPPTEIQNEAMLAPIIGFQKKLLRDRIQASKPMLPLDSKPRRGGRQNAVPRVVYFVHRSRSICWSCLWSVSYT